MRMRVLNTIRLMPAIETPYGSGYLAGHGRAWDEGHIGRDNHQSVRGLLTTLGSK
jgi:hypothetical protein